MARTKREVPAGLRRRPDWLDEPTRRRPGLSWREKFASGLVGSEICGSFRAGHFDRYDTRATGGSSTRRIKQMATRMRRRHEEREVREAVRDS